MTFKFPYFLTSPLMRGEDVKRIQRKLKHNRFKRFYNEFEDGAYGKKSALATRSAKYWTGFPKSKVNGRHTRKLYRILDGKALPVRYRVRRWRRIRKAQGSQREKAFNIALKQVGIKEYPSGSNRVKFSEWYGIIGPWCLMFVTWCFVQAGNKATFIRGSRYAYVPFIVADARSGRYGLRTTSDPIKGDLVAFDWTGGVADHIGIFEKWNQRGVSFYSIEGNTSYSLNSNGGQVMRRLRYRSQVEAFIRVNAG